jgi:anthranilate phosphoribosyltransferase
LEVSNTVSNLKEGIELAKATIDNGKATQMINSLSIDD